MENDQKKWFILNVHILELVLTEMALKIYFPKLHNSFTLLTLSNLIKLNIHLQHS